MTTTYSYACKEFPGMEACPARFYAETEDELWKLIELHASVAHGEDAGEPQSFRPALALHARKFLENSFLILFGNAGSVVADPHPELIIQFV